MTLTGDLIVIAMLCAAVVAGVIAIRQGASWDDIQRVAGEKVAGILPALLILLSIGMFDRTLDVVGHHTVPRLLGRAAGESATPRADGLSATGPDVVLHRHLVGIGRTIGVAMMGTATALGAPLPLIAGAVISGAYFGDKMSPLSDSTILASVARRRGAVYPHPAHAVHGGAVIRDVSDRV
jgi:NhaC family Na+:H+ antiporter